MRKQELRDEQWNRIKALLPGKNSDPGRTGSDNRLFVDAVLWIARTGAAWRELPDHFGAWNSVFQRYNRWARSGVWERAFRALGDDVTFEYFLANGAIVHAPPRVHASPRALAIDTPERAPKPRVLAEASRILAQECKGFSLKAAKEYLTSQYGLVLGLRALRQLMISAGLWRPQSRPIPAVTGPSERQMEPGEVVIWNASKRDWLEGRGDKLCLLYMLDEATRQLTARFVEHDSTEENLRLLATYLKLHGRPMTFHAHRLSLVQTAPKFRRDGKETAGPETEFSRPTQIGRALGELGIGWTAFPEDVSPDPIERGFGPALKQLQEGLRSAGVLRLAEANRYLEETYLSWWNQNVSVEHPHALNAHQPLRGSQSLDGILSVVNLRHLTNDGSIRFQGKLYQITGDAQALIRGGAQVRIEVRLDGSVWARSRERCFAMRERSPEAKSAALKLVRAPVRRRQTARRRDPLPALGRIAQGGLPVWRAAQINRVRLGDRLD